MKECNQLLPTTDSKITNRKVEYLNHPLNIPLTINLNSTGKIDSHNLVQKFRNQMLQFLEVSIYKVKDSASSLTQIIRKD